MIAGHRRSCNVNLDVLIGHRYDGTEEQHSHLEFLRMPPNVLPPNGAVLVSHHSTSKYDVHFEQDVEFPSFPYSQSNVKMHSRQVSLRFHRRGLSQPQPAEGATPNGPFQNESMGQVKRERHP